MPTNRKCARICADMQPLGHSCARVPEIRGGGFILASATEFGKPTRKLNPMPTSREYEVFLTPETEGGFSVAVPALPGCTSQGETREEALSMIREAIEVYVESLVAHSDPIPGPVEIERVTVAGLCRPSRGRRSTR